MQRTKASQVLDYELRDAVSDAKKNEYRRELQIVPNSAALRTIDFRVRTDSQLTMRDRLILLSEIERLDMPAGKEERHT